MPVRSQPLEASPAAAFLIRAGFWFVVFFGLLRSGWVLQNVLIPFAAVQERVAAFFLGKPQTGVIVNASCTGSDAMALCVGVILAFPAPWRRRLLGAVAGLAVITLFNTIRIGHLAAVVENRELFKLLHLQIWPAVMILVAAGFTFWWMRSMTAPTVSPTAPAVDRDGPGAAESRPRVSLAWRLLGLATVFVGIYYAIADRLLTSEIMQRVAHGAASTAGFLMSLVGIESVVDGGFLRNAHGAWIVTPECVTTPLIPIYLATVLAAPLARRTRFIALAATPLVFVILGTARLMVLALPRAFVGSHIVAIHAFYQVVAACLVVAWIARRRDPEGAYKKMLTKALAAGAVVALVAGSLDLRWLRPLLEGFAGRAGLHLGHAQVDAQGAIAILPGFVLGLTVSLWMVAGQGRELSSLARALALALAGSAAAVVLFGELSQHATLTLPVIAIRAVALALPLAVAWALGWVRWPQPEPSRPLAQRLSAS